MRLVITTALVALASSAAYAADAVYSYDAAPAAPAIQAQHDWTGGYVGLNAGYTGGKAKGSFEDESTYVTGSGFIGGAQGGYNFQSGSFVYGVETDIQATNAKAEVKDPDDKGGVKHKWLGTTRARVGFTPTDKVLTYVTGGVAYGNIKSIGDDVRFNKTKVGWTAGAGVEYAVDNNWSVKTEYLYTDLGKTKVDGVDIKFPTHTVRAGVNYKF